MIRVIAVAGNIGSRIRNCRVYCCADALPTRVFTQPGPKVAVAASARETTIGQGFPSPYQPDKGRSAIYRTDVGPDPCWYALCAAIVGNRGKPSGESRVIGSIAGCCLIRGQKTDIEKRITSGPSGAETGSRVSQGQHETFSYQIFAEDIHFQLPKPLFMVLSDRNLWGSVRKYE